MHNMRMFFIRFAQRLNFKNLKQHYSLHGQLNAIMHFTHLRSKHFYPLLSFLFPLSDIPFRLIKACAYQYELLARRFVLGSVTFIYNLL